MGVQGYYIPHDYLCHIYYRQHVMFNRTVQGETPFLDTHVKYIKQKHHYPKLINFVNVIKDAFHVTLLKTCSDLT